MATLFEPSTPLQQAIHGGRREAVLDLLRRSSPRERAAFRPEITSIATVVRAAQYVYGDETFAGWGARPTSEQRGALTAAAVVCGTARDAAPWCDAIDDVLALAKEFTPPSLPDLAEQLMTLSERHITSAQRLIAAGLSRRPETDDYIRGLMELPRVGKGNALDILQHLAADPGLKDVLLRIMDIEGTPDVSLASCDKYNHGDRAWSKILRELSDRGVYPRALLLGKTLDTLERGWIQYRSGWFTNFHTVLNPTIEEMRPHATRYVALLASRIPPTVSFALDAVKTLEGAGLLEPRATLDALRPVFSSAVKGQVQSALKLVDRLLRGDASLDPLAAAVIVPGLAHGSADVQKQILNRLSGWTMDADARASLAVYTHGIAASNRDALRRLMAIDDAVSEPTRAPVETASSATPRRPLSPLDARLRIAPLTDLDDLVESVAYVFEHDTDVDAFERALGALVDAAPFDDTARKRFAPVAKRAPHVRGTVSFQLARLLLFLVTGERGSALPRAVSYVTRAQRHLIERLNDLMDFAAAAPGAPSLATPTHRNGFIDPIAFVERLALHQSRGTPTSRVDFLTGLMRLAPDGMPAAIAPARALAQSACSRALRAALGDAVRVDDRGLLAAATRLRAIAGGTRALRAWHVDANSSSNGRTFHFVNVDPPGPLDVADPVSSLALEAASVKIIHWTDYRSVGGTDAASIRYYATLLPSDMEHVYADGACVISRNLDWWQAQWQDKAYLQELLHRSGPLGPMATLLLAVGLAGKEPGQTAVAVDVLVQAEADGRLDAGRLAATVAELLRSEHAMCSRYARSLSAALRIDGGVWRAVFDTLCAAIVVRSDKPPRDMTAILDLLLEICVARQLMLPAATRSALEAMPIGGAGKKLRTELLARA